MKKLRNIKSGIKNCIKWLPIIWKDRDWDYAFLFEILQFKLKCMRRAFASGKVFMVEEQAKSIVGSLEECVIILDRLIDDDYIDDDTMFSYTLDGSLADEKREKLRKELLESEMKYDEDLRKLFSIIMKNIKRWWD